MSRIICASTSFFILLCTIEALYWPILPKPGIIYAWWQVGILAKAGYVLGLPVLLAIVQSPLSGIVQNLLGWSLAIIWAAAVYFALGFSIRAVGKKHRLA